MIARLMLLCVFAASAAGLAGTESRPQLCDAAHPFMSAGDFNLTEESFQR